MADEKTNQRIVLSRHTLGLYKANGLPGGPVHEAMTMVATEIATLRAFMVVHPEKAITVGDLVRRWEVLADRLREKAH